MHGLLRNPPGGCDGLHFVEERPVHLIFSPCYVLSTLLLGRSPYPRHRLHKVGWFNSKTDSGKSPPRSPEMIFRYTRVNYVITIAKALEAIAICRRALDLVHAQYYTAVSSSPFLQCRFSFIAIQDAPFPELVQPNHGSNRNSSFRSKERRSPPSSNKEEYAKLHCCSTQCAR